ncbi:Ankyrin repeat domain-containing protein 40 [Lunasporangiospora selenospora]|uniref:Ankyrin repeat domain-containing protein 40 n=1 Tax=Lunasporangiospora selenospora TaxID=979761 RepID=A0A9P6FKK9_9FUNG|nr:Ankyrin repeat domain-containing protein 40 [Lunasporangiospora selenospora]
MRISDLHEMAAVGNLKAVLHYCQSGVDINGQNAMNGWTALHWASHRGHEPIVRALLMRGAQKDVLTHKGERAEDLAKKPEICALFGKEYQEPTADEAGQNLFVPSYLAQPDLAKIWSMPEGSTEDPKLNQEAFALSNPSIGPNTAVPKIEPGRQPARPSTSAHVPAAKATTPGPENKEILVYSQSVSDENLLGSIFAQADDSIERTIALIQEEIDDLPESFTLSKFNGSKTIPVNTKQYSRKTGDLFRGDEDAIVLVSKTPATSSSPAGATE